MSWQRTVLGVVIAASGSLGGCVLQGERHEDRLMNDVCALAQEAGDELDCTGEAIYTATCGAVRDCDSKKLGEDTIVAVELSDEGKEVEPAPAVATPSWRIEYDCVVEQTRLRNLCGPELTALNECVLDLVEEKSIKSLFACVAKSDTFNDPGQRDEGGNSYSLAITRITPLGYPVLDPNLVARGDPNNCNPERDVLYDCAAGR